VIDLRIGVVCLVALAAGCMTGPRKPVDCKVPCRERGQCAVRTTPERVQSCYAASDADCSRSDACKTAGACYAAEDGTCVPKSELAARSCAQSTQCKSWGGCAPKGGWCRPATDAHCRGAFHCLTRGACTRVLDSCVPEKAEDCAASTGCTMEGLCELVPARFIYSATCGVRPGPTACKASKACAAYERCEARSPSGSSRIAYCARPDEIPQTPCAGAADPVCLPDGRCLRDERNACVRDPAAPKRRETSDRRGPVSISSPSKDDSVFLSVTTEGAAPNEPLPPGAGVDATASCRYGDRWYRARLPLATTRPLRGSTRLRKGTPTRCEVELRVRPPSEEHYTWCWNEVTTETGPCDRGPPVDRGAAPVTISDVSATYRPTVANWPPRLELSYDEYVDVDAPPPFYRRPTPRPSEASIVTLRWTCRDGRSEESEQRLDNENYPRGFFYSLTKLFEVDQESSPPGNEAARPVRRTRLQLPCDLDFTYAHQRYVDGRPSDRKETSLFHGCLDRTGVVPGACATARREEDGGELSK
jgi:hypothetical protein